MPFPLQCISIFRAIGSVVSLFALHDTYIHFTQQSITLIYNITKEHSSISGIIMILHVAQTILMLLPITVCSVNIILHGGYWFLCHTSRKSAQWKWCLSVWVIDVTMLGNDVLFGENKMRGHPLLKLKSFQQMIYNLCNPHWPLVHVEILFNWF